MALGPARLCCKSWVSVWQRAEADMGGCGVWVGQIVETLQQAACLVPSGSTWVTELDGSIRGLAAAGTP